MKKLLKSFTTFTRTERMGFVCLCSLLIILIIIRATMSLWVHPEHDAEKDQKLVAAWETFKRANPAKAATDTSTNKSEYQDAFDDNETPLPDTININTADSATFVRLKGIGPATAGQIIAYRKQIGHFTNVNQLLEVRHIPDATFTLLKKHLTVGPAK